MKAYWCWTRLQQPERDTLTFEDAVNEAKSKKDKDSGFLAIEEDEKSAVLVAEPELAASAAYGTMVDRFKRLERSVCA